MFTGQVATHSSGPGTLAPGYVLGATVTTDAVGESSAHKTATTSSTTKDGTPGQSDSKDSLGSLSSAKESTTSSTSVEGA